MKKEGSQLRNSNNQSTMIGGFPADSLSLNCLVLEWAV